MNNAIIQAIIDEIEIWHKLGYSFKFGIEQEYQYKKITVMEAGVNGAAAGGLVIARDVVERKRAELLEGVKDEALRGMINGFKPEELARFDLEKRCVGATTTTVGDYYDKKYSERVMEIAFAAKPPLEAINDFHMVLSLMSEINKELKIGPLLGMYKTDISFSVWQGDNNLTDIKNRDPRALAIMDGLLRYVYDAAPVFMRKHRIDNYLSFQNIDTGPVRAASVRQADGRLEIRLDNNPAAGEHIASTILAIMRSTRFGFMMHGIESEALALVPEDHPSKDSTSPYFTTTSRFGIKKIFEPIDKANDSAFYTLEILNGAKILQDGCLQINPKHLFIYGQNRPHVKKELEVRDGADVKGWFSNIRVENERVIWPPLGEITDNPDKVQQKLSNISFGREITVIKSSGYQVNPGYAQHGNNMMAAHTDFMRGSPNLQMTYNAEMLANLASLLMERANEFSKFKP